MNDYLKSAELAFSPLIGVAPLMRRAFIGEDLRPLGQTLLSRAQNNPNDANAYFDLATVLQLTGDRDVALAVQAQAFQIQSIFELPLHRENPQLRLLCLMGPGDLMANTPIEFLLEDSNVSIDLLFLSLDIDLPELVPDHDVLLVCVAESDHNQALLKRISMFIENWPRPIINLPEK